MVRIRRSHVVDTNVGALDLVSIKAEADPLPSLETEIRMLEQERERLVAAVAAGGSLDALVAALRQREARLKALELRRTELRTAWRKAPRIDRAKVRRDLVTMANEWRHVLVGEPVHARPILRSLLDGRVTITPTMPKVWELRGQGTLAGFFSRCFPLGMASPPGFEPGFQP